MVAVLNTEIAAGDQHGRLRDGDQFRDEIEPDVGGDDDLGIHTGGGKEVEVLPQDRLRQHNAEHRVFVFLVSALFRLVQDQMLQLDVLEGKRYAVLDLEGQRLFNALAVGKGEAARCAG